MDYSYYLLCNKYTEKTVTNGNVMWTRDSCRRAITYSYNVKRSVVGRHKPVFITRSVSNGVTISVSFSEVSVSFTVISLSMISLSMIPLSMISLPLISLPLISLPLPVIISGTISVAVKALIAILVVATIYSAEQE